MAHLAPPHIPALHVRDYARKTLKPRHRRVVRAFAEALFFDPGRPYEEGRLDALVEDCDRFMSPASKTLRFGLRLALEVIRWLPPLVMRRLTTFEELTTAERVTMLERLEQAKAPHLVLVLIAYKTLLSLLFFEDPRELTANGYPGPERHLWRKSLPLAGAVPTPSEKR